MRYITPKNLIIICSVFAVSIFVFVDYLCKGNICYDIKFQLESPLYFFVGLIMSLLFFLFSSQEFFQLWQKRILSWFLILLILIASSESPYPGGILTFDRGDVVIGMMTLLFIITLVYVPIMHRIQKKREES